MKLQLVWFVTPLLALSLSACKKKEEAAAPPAGKPTLVEKVVEKAAEIIAPGPKVVALTADERAAKLGFAKHLSPDTEYLISFYNGTKTADRVKASKLWKLVEKQMTGGMGMGMGMGADAEADAPIEDMPAEAEPPEAAAGEEMAAEPEAAATDAADATAQEEFPAAPEEAAAPADELPATPDAEIPPVLTEDAAEGADEIGPAMLFGSEVTLALGKPSGVQLGHLAKINARMTYFQMRGLAKAFVAAAKDGSGDDFAEAMVSSYALEVYSDLLKDPESGVAMLEALKMPPITAAFKVAPAKREGAAQQISGMLSSANMLGEMVEPVEAEKAGSKFVGFKLLGEKIAKTLSANRESMEGMIEPAMADRLLAAIAKNNIVVTSGTVGDYVVVFIGSSLDELVLAEDPGKSLVGGDGLAFFDAYAGKDLSALIYGEKAASEAVVSQASGLSAVTDGLRDGIAGSEALGDTRDLEAMFQVVSDREAVLMKMGSIEAQGIVAFFEDGLKIESYGGMDKGASAWKKPNKLSHLGDAPEVVLFANMNVTDEYDTASREYFEALLGTAYGITMKVAELPMKDEKFTEFARMARLFDGQFRGDTVALWQALSGDFGQGLGTESALVVDMKGTAPAIPGLPQQVVDEAKVPRISLISPVVDRAKLAASWEKLNTSTTKILAGVSKMTGQEIPMQKPLSSDKNALTTWFFPLPFFNDDFLPSVTVGDSWFAASTSKNQALDLISKAQAGGPETTGFSLAVNFKALEAYAKETSKLVEENAQALTGSALTSKDKALIEEGILALSELDKMTVHSRLEGATLRSSVHFKTR